MKCIITSSKNQEKFEKITSVTVPAYSGELQILPGHAEGFIALEEGEMLLEAKSKTESLPIKEGVCHIKDDTLCIIL